MADLSKIYSELKKLEKFIKHDVREIIGKEAVDHFTENFDKQSFDGKKWDEVKRRDSSSTWYGFKYGAKTKPPKSHPKRKGSSKPYKKRKDGAATNYSPTAKSTRILSSRRSELENSIRFRKTTKGIVVYSDKKYARIHNEGGTIKVFGKTSATMPKRQFIGKSSKLEKRLQRVLTNKLKSLG